MVLSETGSFKMNERCGHIGGDCVLRFLRGVKGKVVGTGHLRVISVKVSRTLEKPPPVCVYAIPLDTERFRWCPM